MSTDKLKISFKIFQNDLSWCIQQASQKQIIDLISELRILIYTLENFLDSPAPRKKNVR